VSKQNHTMLVVGATGSVGRHVVAEGLRRGYAIRALVRDRQRAGRVLALAETVIGDLTDARTLDAAVDGIDAVVFTHGSNGAAPGPEAVDYGAVRNVLAALRGRRIRIALMTAVGVTDRKGAHDWKRRGERLVRASGLPYTIVRPGWFDMNGDDQHRLVMLQGDTRQSGTPADGVISRAQLARVLVASLTSEAALNKTFELGAETGRQQDDFDGVAAVLAPDVPGLLDGAYDAHNMPALDEPARVRADLDAVRVAFAPAPAFTGES